MDKEPTSYFLGISNEYVTYTGVLLVSVWGGVVSYLDSMKTFSWIRLFTHVLSASFAGMMTFFMCQSAGIHGPLVGALCGLAAHMGTPAVVRLLMKNKTIKQFFGEGDE